MKIFEISYFSFTFKLNEKKRVPFKKIVLERGIARKVLLVLIFKIQYDNTVHNINKANP